MIRVKFPRSRKKEEVSTSELDLDKLQELLEMTDAEFREWLRSYGFAE